MHIKIGTRGSKLALWQAYFVENLLKQNGINTEIVIIETKGDKILDRSLSKIGSKGLFTEEIEEQLRSREIDIAVHSAKDLQSELAEEFELLAFAEREDVNDVLVSFNKNLSLESGESFVVGTSSTRRIAMLKAFYPQIKTVDMRGNLQTRIQKLKDGHAEALLLAYAGVHRMEYDDLINEKIPFQKFIPAVGQGSVAIQSLKDLSDDKKLIIRKMLNHEATEQCLLAERAFLKTLQGGCSVPVFGLAKNTKDGIEINGGVISLDGSQVIIEKAIGNAKNPAMIGQALAEKVIAKGGKKILDEIKRHH
jgi:hydroxymethylbilane synthase